MESSILTSTKKILGVSPDYTAFDLDILTHINAAFAVVNQLGIGPDGSFTIEDDSADWEDIGLPADQTNLLRTYIFLKVRILFDPPATGFLVDATNKQIAEYEYRLSYLRENAIPLPTPTKGVMEDVEIEEGWLGQYY